jgi:methylated-DNA-[protein]-cysteine S-methyltransferase
MRRKGKSTLTRDAGLTYSLFPTAIGWCGVVYEGKRMVKIEVGYPHPKSIEKKILRECGNGCVRIPPQGEVVENIRRYASGEKVRFKAAFSWSSFTSFQRKVYREAMSIPYGAVETYGSLAQKIGCSGASRAVGSALARNPFPLVIPCHRVVRGDGRLGGFSAGGGSALKRKLLMLEGEGQRLRRRK